MCHSVRRPRHAHNKPTPDQALSELRAQMPMPTDPFWVEVQLSESMNATKGRHSSKRGVMLRNLQGWRKIMKERAA